MVAFAQPYRSASKKHRVQNPFSVNICQTNERPDKSGGWEAGSVRGYLCCYESFRTIWFFPLMTADMTFTFLRVEGWGRIWGGGDIFIPLVRIWFPGSARGAFLGWWELPTWKYKLWQLVWKRLPRGVSLDWGPHKRLPRKERGLQNVSLQREDLQRSEDWQALLRGDCGS